MESEKYWAHKHYGPCTTSDAEHKHRDKHLITPQSSVRLFQQNMWNCEQNHEVIQSFSHGMSPTLCAHSSNQKPYIAGTHSTRDNTSYARLSKSWVALFQHVGRRSKLFSPMVCIIFPPFIDPWVHVRRKFGILWGTFIHGPMCLRVKDLPCFRPSRGNSRISFLHELAGAWA